MNIAYWKGNAHPRLGREIMYLIHRWRHRVATAKGTHMASGSNTTDDDFKQLEQASQTVFGSK